MGSTGLRGRPTRVPLCPAHRLCSGAASLRSGLCYVLRRLGMHTPPAPGTRGHKAGIAEAGEGGRHSDQQAPFVPPSIAIDRRQTGLHFRVSISAVPGGDWQQFAGEEEWGPITFCQSDAQGAARQIGERCQIGQWKARALVPASPRAREAAPGSGLPGPDLSSAINRNLGSPAGGQPSPSTQQRWGGGAAPPPNPTDPRG